MVEPVFARDGCAHIASLLNGVRCEAVLGGLPAAARAGSRRLLDLPWCRDLAAELRANPALSALLPAGAAAVQCTAFEKSADLNWLVAAHQDLSLPVAERVSHPALHTWSEKEGSLHVQPPAELLQQMVAVRLHLDDCLDDDGPLRVWPGSHLHGVLSVEEAGRLRSARSPLSCTGPQGSAWVMRPLLLHASSKARGSSRRRVLHFLFGPPHPPFGLRWFNPA